MLVVLIAIINLANAPENEGALHKMPGSWEAWSHHEHVADSTAWVRSLPFQMRTQMRRKFHGDLQRPIRRSCRSPWMGILRGLSFESKDWWVR